MRRSRKKKQWSFPKWKRPKLSFNLKAFAKALAVIAILVAAGFAYNFLQTDLSKLQSLSNKVQPKLHIRVLRANPEKTAFYEKQLRGYIEKTLKDSPTISLAQLSERLQKTFSAEQISLVMVNEDELHLRMIPRTAVLGIREDAKLMISEKAEVYFDRYVTDTPSMLVSGLVEEKANQRRYDYEGRLLIDAKKQDLVDAAVQLQQAVKKSGFAFNEMRYTGPRGFILVATENLPTVIIGDAQFDERLQRLEALLKSTKQRAQVATKIELDYSDKAFIQEKKL